MFATGPLTSLLNPKIAMYPSLIPQIGEPQQGHVPLQSLVLGLVHAVVTVNLLLEQRSTTLRSA